MNHGKAVEHLHFQLYLKMLCYLYSSVCHVVIDVLGSVIPVIATTLQGCYVGCVNWLVGGYRLFRRMLISWHGKPNE